MDQVLTNPLLLYHILFYTDYNTVLIYCRSCVQAQQIYQDPVFWEQRAVEILDLPRDIFRAVKLPPAQRYLQLLTERGGVAYGSEKYITLEQCLRRAIQQDRPDLIQYITSHLRYDHWLIQLKEYARKSDKKHVDHFLRLTGNYRIAAQGVVEGELGESPSSQLLFTEIRAAAPDDYPWNWNKLARLAVKHGHLSLFDDIRSINCQWNWTELAGAAICIKDTFEYIRSLAREYQWNWNYLAGQAAMQGNKGMFEYIRSLAPPDYEWHWNGLAEQAVVQGSKGMFEYIKSLTPPDHQWNWNDLAGYAARYGTEGAFEYIYSIAPLEYQWNWNYLSSHALIGGNRLLFDHIRSLAAPDYQWH